MANGGIRGGFDRAGQANGADCSEKYDYVVGAIGQLRGFREGVLLEVDELEGIACISSRIYEICGEFLHDVVKVDKLMLLSHTR